MSKEAAVETPVEAEVRAVSSSELRQSIFKNAKKPQRRQYTFNGVQLEYVQPSIGSMYGKNENGDGPSKAFIIKSMIDNTVAPGTDDRVFEDSDYDAIMEMPATGDLQEITKIITELLDLKVDDKVKN
jgi:hypothetical protein